LSIVPCLRIGLQTCIPRSQLLFARVLRDTQLIEVALLLLGNDSIAQQERMLGRLYLYILPAGKNLMATMLFIPLGERSRHVHLLNDVPPAHARVVGTER